jgi:hypothetical protein
LFQAWLSRLLVIVTLAISCLVLSPFPASVWPAPSLKYIAQNVSSPREAFETGRSKVWLEFQGKVIRILKDDLKGRRHQKFIIQQEDGLTLLISHNIDLSARIPIQKGSIVEGFGRYEWNHMGGVIHWTHQEPRKRIPGGWIRFEGKVYR